MPRKVTNDLSSSDELFPPSLEGREETEYFLTHLLKRARDTHSRYLTIPRERRDNTTQGMIDYWRNAESTLKWAIAINGRRKVNTNGEKGTRVG